MGATVIFGKTAALFDADGWHSSDASFAAVLTAITPSQGGHDPDYPRTVATAVVAALGEGARIVHLDETPPLDPAAVY